MRGISQETFADGRERLETLLATGRVDAAALGDALFAVTDVLAANPGLRRALTDPARDGQAKAELAERLFGARLPGEAVDVLAGAARGRWSAAGDLTDAVESYAVTACSPRPRPAAASTRWRTSSSGSPAWWRRDQGLRDAFSYRTQGADRKAELIHRLLDGRAAPETVRLAVQAAARPRGLRTEQVLEQLVQAAAERRQQVVAQVVAATPLTTQQRDRLEAALRRRYGRVRLNIDVDPAVIGGMRVQVGSELVDGTVAARLEDARRRLAG